MAAIRSRVPSFGVRWYSLQTQQGDKSPTEQELEKLEMDLLESCVRCDRELISSLLAEEFCEFGSSGRVYSRQATIDALQLECPNFYSVTDLSVTILGEGAALVRYRVSRHGKSEPENSHSLRSSVWTRRDGRWQQLFHQGTRISSEGV